jgi:hypothetical protein
LPRCFRKQRELAFERQNVYTPKSLNQSMLAESGFTTGKKRGK